jgi:hypothetical protein
MFLLSPDVYLCRVLLIKQEQSNLTALNTIVWGTCNTDLSQDTCSANMAWFASTLKSVCSAELDGQNLMAVTTLQSIHVHPRPHLLSNNFHLLRSSGIRFNAYCRLSSRPSNKLILLRRSRPFFYALNRLVTHYMRNIKECVIFEVHEML